MATIRKGTGKGSLVSNIVNPTAVITPPVISQPSAPIVPSTPTPALALAIPTAWTQPEMAVVASSGATSNYVKFTHPMMQDYLQVMQKTGIVADGTPLLFFPNGDISILPQLKFITMNAQQYWALEDDNGEMVNGDWKKHRGEDNGMRWNERILVAMLVELDGEWYPATTELKGPKCQCGEKAMQTFHIAKDVKQWSSLSPDHMFSSQVQQTQFRYVTNVSLSKKTSKGNQDYIIADGQCVPITGSQLQSLINAFSDEGFNDDMKAVVESYNERLEQVKGLIQ